MRMVEGDWQCRHSGCAMHGVRIDAAPLPTAPEVGTPGLVALIENFQVALRAIGPVYYHVQAAAERAAKRGDTKTADALELVYGRIFWMDHALGTLQERVNTDGAQRGLPPLGSSGRGASQ